ncbi:aminopeptidase N [Nocardioides albertanoniae]|uniref:Aminopeptidase N n=1 Tax=Nocardioides albertanoniae TaxID=1175486 RepID=A0A543A809_9ACTN|nr:aminopeptidase N [Nocardioides albertanoniae]TQL68659.1 aminopeptidase N [Nocardioides albertanoniae]
MTIQSLPLRRDEAASRATLLSIDDYDVRLDLASSEETFGSVTTIRFTSQGGPTFVDLKPVSVEAIRLNGRPVAPSELAHGRLPITTQEGANELVVEATMPFRNDGEGLHRSVDPADGKAYVYGMCFMDAAPTIFACFDQPDLKAPYTFHVTAPHDWTVIGNAPGAQTEPGVWELERSQPLSTYFVTLVAGPWHMIHDEHDGIPLSLSSRQSIAADLDKDAEELFTLTKQCFDEFHRLFGIRYPFGNYHQAFVPEFNAGAMENPGCVTFRDPMIFTSRVTRGMRIQRATTVAHEMAHQWFGDLVTPQWWDDLWLNESFAEYMGNRVTAEVTEYDDAWADVSYARRQWGLTADQRGSTHSVAGNGAEDAVSALQNFDGISYSKGSAILRQLAAALGDDVFFAGAIDHFTTHRFGNATMHDLFASWAKAAEAAGVEFDLDTFTSQWLLTAGPDTLSWDPSKMVINRTAPALHPADRSHTFRAAILNGTRWTTEEITVTGDRTPLQVAANAVVLDPYDDTWAAAIPDWETVQALKGALPSVTDGRLRAGVWNNLRSAWFNAAVDPADIVDIAEASLPVEDLEDTHRRTMPWLFGSVVPLAPEGARERLHDAAIRKLDEVAPGSELQLSAYRAAIRSASSQTLLRRWLVTPPDGIETDLDLRWRVLTKLAEHGFTTREELRAAYAAEPANEARIHLNGALASLPDAEAKAFAWSVFTGETDLPNYDILAVGHGLWRGPAELTEAYVERYFDELPATAAKRSGWSLAEAAEAFFPAHSVTEATLGAARAVIEHDLDPGVRRRVADAADNLQRHLAVKITYPRG